MSVFGAARQQPTFSGTLLNRDGGPEKLVDLREGYMACVEALAAAEARHTLLVGQQAQREARYRQALRDAARAKAPPAAPPNADMAAAEIEVALEDVLSAADQLCDSVEHVAEIIPTLRRELAAWRAARFVGKVPGTVAYQEAQGATRVIGVLFVRFDLPENTFADVRAFRTEIASVRAAAFVGPVAA